MKRLVYLGLIMVTGLSFNTFAQESDSTGMPGDNFNLAGALNLFKESKNLEDFEKKLNSESSKVNNLDLNGDNKIDYIRVVDKKDGDNHAILLQVPINKKENQDIAAIAIEKRSDKEAQLQIIGNESIYGEETIMEPVDEKETKKSTGPATLNAPTVVVFVNAWYWPCVQYVYDPFYDPWYSPYYWDYYPSWWNPWRPVYYSVYYQRMYYYHDFCHYTPYYHVPHAHAIYAANHSNSNTVHRRYESQRAAFKGRSTYNQSAGGSKGRVEQGNNGTTNPQGRTGGMEGKSIRPTTTPEQRTLKEGTTPRENTTPRESTAPRPVNSNNRGNVINNGGVERNNNNNNGNMRTVEPSRREPVTPQPRTQPQVQPRPVERSPQRVNPQPQQRQTQPMRQAPQQRQQTPPMRSTPQPTQPRPGGGRGR